MLKIGLRYHDFVSLSKKNSGGGPPPCAFAIRKLTWAISASVDFSPWRACLSQAKGFLFDCYIIKIPLKPTVIPYYVARSIFC